MLSDPLCVQASVCVWQWGWGWWGAGSHTRFNWRYSITTVCSNLLCTILSATHILHRIVSSSYSTCNRPIY